MFRRMMNIAGIAPLSLLNSGIHALIYCCMTEFTLKSFSDQETIVLILGDCDSWI